MKRPFLGIGISIVFGVIFAFYFNIGAYISFLMFLALALGYLFTIIINKNRPYLILLLLLIILFSRLPICLFPLKSSSTISPLTLTLEA